MIKKIDAMILVPYALAIGLIMYVMTFNRPDVAYCLSMVCRYQGNPSTIHRTTVKNILKYLQKTKDMIFVFGSIDELKVSGYSNFSFQTGRDNSYSQSDWVFLLNGGSIIWKIS